MLSRDLGIWVPRRIFIKWKDGENMYDVITIGDALITFDPSSQGPLRFVDTFQRKVGGAEFNFAIGCARLGLKTSWISRLGNDEFGRYIYNFARGEGIDVSEVTFVDNYPTSVYFKEVMADGSGSSYYYRSDSPTLTLTAEHLNEEVFKNAKVLHISGVFPAITKQNIQIINKAIEYAKKHEVKISLDPNIRLKLWSKKEARDTLLNWMPIVDYLLIGIDEAEILFGTRHTDELIKQAQYYGVSHLFIKRGKDGAAVWHNGSCIETPAVKTEAVVDTVGAGDGFGVGVIYALIHKWDLNDTLQLANTIGSMVVSVQGDNEGLPYLEDVMIKMENKEKVER